jgi:cyclopropane-fatty-acyl-phospholipid synthase
MSGTSTIQPLLENVLGTDVSVRVTAYDGTDIGPRDAPATIVVRSPGAIRRIVTGLGRELGFARAYVAGELEIEGDIYAVLSMKDGFGVRPSVALLSDAGAARGVSDQK